jgi:hypothetical protein
MLKVPSTGDFVIENLNPKMSGIVSAAGYQSSTTTSPVRKAILNIVRTRTTFAMNIQVG